MALPTLLTNQPEAGSISWSAFGIQYDGTSYDIPAGYTNKKFVYWDYNAGKPTITRKNLASHGNAGAVALQGEGGGVGSITRSTEQSKTGTWSTKFVWTSGSRGISLMSAVGQNPFWSGAKVNTTYTISAWVYWASGQQPVFSLQNGSWSATGITISASKDRPSAMGKWERIYFTFQTTGAVAGLRAYNTSSAAATFYVDAVLVEEAPLRDYFDGNFPNTLFDTYTWDGATDASTSTAVEIVGVRNLALNPSFETPTAASYLTARTNQMLAPVGPHAAVAGWAPSARWAGSGGTQAISHVTNATDGPISQISRYVRKTWSVIGASAGDIAFSFNHTNRIAVTPGQIFSVSYWWRASWALTGSNNQFRASFYTAATGGSATTTLNGTAVAKPGANEWQRVSYTFTVPASVTHMDVFHYVDTAALPSVGSTMDATGFLVELSSAVEPYFDGSFTPDSDLFPTWSGTAFASVSFLRGLLPENTAAGNNAVIAISNQWAKSGTRSVRGIPTGNNYATEGWVQPAGSFSTMSGFGVTFEAGKTYTIVATSRIAAPQTTTSSIARRMQFVYNTVAGWTGAVSANSPQAPNVAGATEHRLTVSIPHNALWAGLRLGIGSGQGGGDVWWDDLLVTEVPSSSAPYTGPFFDGGSTSGDSIDMSWQGLPNMSASVRYSVVPGIVMTDVLPNPLEPEDCLLFLNKNGVGVLVPTTQVIEGSLIVSGSVLADAIGANQIDAWHLRANSITANAIAANAITSPAIAAGAISTEKLTVASVSGTLVPNGSFEDLTQGWTVMQAGAGFNADVVTGVASSGASALRLQRGSEEGEDFDLIVAQDEDYMVGVSPSGLRRWYVACRAGASAALPNGFSLRVYWYQGDRVTPSALDPVYDIADDAPLGTTWSLFEGQVTPPEDARYARLAVKSTSWGSTVYVDEVVMHQVTVSAMIGDGAIQAVHVTANAITADAIAANAVGADAIAANSILANHLTVGAIQTNHLSPAVGQEIDISANQAVNLIAADVQAVVDDMGNITDEMAVIATALSVLPNAVEITQANSDYKLSLTSNSVSIMKGVATVSTWNESGLNADQFKGKSVIVGIDANGVGGHQIAAGPNGSTIVKGL